MPKTGTPGREDRRVDRRGARGVHRRRPAGEDQRGRAAGEHLGHRHRVRHDLGVDPRLAHAAGDQLGVLRPEVDDEDQVVLRLAGGSRHGRSLSACRRRPAAGRAPGPGRSGSEAGSWVRTAGAAPGGPRQGREFDGATRPPQRRVARGVTWARRRSTRPRRSGHRHDRQPQGARRRLRHHRVRRARPATTGRYVVPSARPRVGLALVGPERHRPLRLGGDRQRRVDARGSPRPPSRRRCGGRGGRRRAGSRRSRRSPGESPIAQPPRKCAVSGRLNGSPIEPPGRPPITLAISRTAWLPAGIQVGLGTP